MKKKIIFIILAIFFLSGYLFFGNSVGKYDSLRNLKQLLPPKVKNFIKKNIFYYQYNKHIEKELKILKEVKKNNKHRQEFLNSINEKKNNETN